MFKELTPHTNSNAIKLLHSTVETARVLGEARARNEGRIPSDVIRSGHDAAAYERYIHHYGQGMTSMTEVGLVYRLHHLTAELCRVAQVDMATREGMS